MGSTWTDIVSSLSNVGLLVVAGFTALFAYQQLKELVQQVQEAKNANVTASEELTKVAEQITIGTKANEMANLMGILQIELMVANSRSAWSDAMHKAATTPNADPKLDIAFIDEKREQYFNVLDRLCACLRRGYFNEKEYREDYRLQINDAVTTYSAQFGPGTRFRNILTVHDTWKDGRYLKP